MKFLTKPENRRCFLPLVILAGTGIALSSCSMNSAGGGIASYQAYDRPAKLPTDPDKVKVKVSLSKQRTYVMEGDGMLLVMPVSVGEAITPTPTGNFRIYHKDAKRRDKTHGYAKKGDRIRRTKLINRPAGWGFRGTPMPYWSEFKPDYGFHTGWVKHYPCTNGCIRMHENVAPKFFRLVSEGTPVSIAYTQPEDAKHANIPLPPDAGPHEDHPLDMYYQDGYFSHHKTPVFD
jgi:hypothetical protein